MPAETVLSLITKSAAFFEEKGIDEAKRSAEYLLAHAMGQKRLQLYLRFDQPVADDELARFRELVRRRLKHEPVQYLVGTTEFYGMEFAVSPAVLIPRPETEHLVEAIIDRVRDERLPRTARILDIGTGSGIIAITLAAQLPEVQVTGIDISSAGLDLARENAARNKVDGRLSLLSHDILLPQLDGVGAPFDIVVSNPPYIAQSEIETLQPEVRAYEPVAALTDGGDGLAFYRRMAALLPRLLVPGGMLGVEIGFGQASEVTAIFAGAGLGDIEIIKDYSGIERVVLGRLITA
ncbi:MAG: peptide chain release factor N(5)-glutamine methyltransferase [Bacteroidetes bacterium]|nr:peptide chain release factor N(5)-glutamine methyltransferase [Bacteroidota bacterium]